MALVFLLVLHRDLGSIDETATEIERAETILYHYPEDVSLRIKLERLKLIESLIDFSQKFSLHSLDSVVMKNTAIGFYNCEPPHIWMVAGYENLLSAQSVPSSVKQSARSFRGNSGDEGFRSFSLPVHAASTLGIRTLLSRIHGNFRVFEGLIATMFMSCLAVVQEVKQIRKSIRKSRVALQQLQQDLDYVEGSARDKDTAAECGDSGVEIVIGYYKAEPQLESEIRETELKIAALEERINAIISQDYKPLVIRDKVARHVRFFMETGEFITPSLINSMQSCSFSAYATATSSSIFSTIIQARHIIRQSFCGNCKGFIITYENQVVHSTITSDMTQILCQFVQQHDFLCLRRKLQRLGRVIESDNGREYFTRKRFSFIGGNNNSNNSKKNLEDWIDGRLSFDDVWGKKGFICEGWSTVDFEMLAGKSLLSRNSPSQSADLLDDVISPHCVKPLGLYFPFLNIDDSSQRLLIYRQKRFTVMLLIAWPMKLGVDAVNIQIVEDPNDLVDSVPIVNMCLDLQLSLKSHLAVVDLALLSRQLEQHSVGAKGAKSSAAPAAPVASSGAATAANASARAGETRLIEYDGLNNSLKLSGFTKSIPFHPILVLSCMVDMVHGNGRGAGILRRDVMEALSHKLAREVDLIHLFSPALLSISFSSPAMRVLNDVWAQLSEYDDVVELTVRLTRASKGGQWVSGRKTRLISSLGTPVATPAILKKLSKYHYVWGSGYTTLNDLAEVLFSAYSKYGAVQQQQQQQLHKAIVTPHEAPPSQQSEEIIRLPTDLIFLGNTAIIENSSELESGSKPVLPSEHILSNTVTEPKDLN